MYNVRREAYIWKQFQFFIFKSPSWIKAKERGNDHLCLVPDELSLRVQKKANGAGLGWWSRKTEAREFLLRSWTLDGGLLGGLGSSSDSATMT